MMIYRLSSLIYAKLQIAQNIDFQYRFIINLLVTKVRITFVEKRENPLCTFCLRGNESIQHLFIECEHVKQIWQKFTQYINEKANIVIELPLTPKQIILNRIMDRSTHVVNFLILVVNNTFTEQDA